MRFFLPCAISMNWKSVELLKWFAFGPLVQRRRPVQTWTDDVTFQKPVRFPGLNQHGMHLNP